MADTVNPNMALVQRMYECFNKNDMETIRREDFRPDLVWNLPGRHPLAGTKHRRGGGPGVLCPTGEGWYPGHAGPGGRSEHRC